MRSSTSALCFVVVLGLLLAGAAGCVAASESVTPETSSARSKSSTRPQRSPHDSRGNRNPSPAPSELLAWVDLQGVLGTNAHSLSGTYYDPLTRTLYAVADDSPQIVSLEVADNYQSFAPGASVALSGSRASQWDAEALVRRGEDFYLVAEETSATVERFDDGGSYQGTLTLPSIYRHAQKNKGLESLTLSPSGRYLWTANESALPGDPPATASTGTTVRILRRNLESGNDEACAYRTELVSRDNGGVSDLLALSDTELLVLERDFQEGLGNTVRLFQVDLGRVDSERPGTCSASLLSSEPLAETAPVLPKKLVLDFFDLPSAGVPHPGTQRSNLLANYEALALGPLLNDGRLIVFVTSDDNANRGSPQVARTLVLALRIP